MKTRTDDTIVTGSGGKYKFVWLDRVAPTPDGV